MIDRIGWQQRRLFAGHFQDEHFGQEIGPDIWTAYRPQQVDAEGQRQQARYGDPERSNCSRNDGVAVSLFRNLAALLFQTFVLPIESGALVLKFSFECRLSCDQLVTRLGVCLDELSRGGDDLLALLGDELILMCLAPVGFTCRLH